MGKFIAAVLTISALLTLTATGAVFVWRHGIAPDAGVVLQAKTSTVSDPVTKPSPPTPTETAFGGASPPVGSQATATPLPALPEEPIVVPTRCAATVIIPAGQPLHVIGPGSAERDIPAPGDYVRDDCTGNVYFRDPTTGAELPTTQIGDLVASPTP